MGVGHVGYVAVDMCKQAGWSGLNLREWGEGHCARRVGCWAAAMSRDLKQVQLGIAVLGLC